MAKRLPVEVQKQINELTEAFRQRLTELFEWSNDEETARPATAVEIEDKIREWIRQIGKDTQMLVLGGMDRYRRKGKQSCPQCEEAVYWERYEPRNYIMYCSEHPIGTTRPQKVDSAFQALSAGGPTHPGRC